MMTQPRGDGCVGCIGLSNLYIVTILLEMMKPTKLPQQVVVGQLEQEWGQEARPSH